MSSLTNGVRQAFRVCVRAGCFSGLRQARIWIPALALAFAAGPLAAQTTFTNANTILLPVPPGTGPASTTYGEPGSLYPSIINVSGLGAQIQKLTVTINDFRHTSPDDVDMLLVGPQGQKMIIWSDVGQLYSTCSVDFGTLDCNNGAGLGWAGPTVTLDDAALVDLSMFLDSAIVTGTYKPTNVGSANDMFPSPAPIGPYASPRPEGTAMFASVFNGANPNGAWSLYVIDDALSFSGRINGGWSLTITTAGTALLPTTTTLTGATPSPSSVGQSVTVQYAVTAAAGTPSGFVTVSDGVNSCTGTVAAGSCLLALNTAGTRILSANYAGDGAYSSSTSAGILHTVGAPDLTITKTHAGVFSRGQIGAAYTITVRNAGAVPSAGTVTVADILPAGLAATGISGAGWNCAQPAGPCSRSDALAANGSFPSLTLVVNVAANAPAGVTNVATVSGGGDSNASNNTASDPTSTAGAVQGILTITKWGSATGTVASADGGIDCGATCQHSYAAGTTITIEATPDAGAVFAGWLGACNGNGSCIVDVIGDTSITANFAQDAIGSISLDIDDDGNYDALTDGILVIRYLFGLTGSTLTNGATAVNANRTDPAQVLTYLDDIEPVLDIDGNSQTDAMTDGLIVMRYLFGMRGAVLVQGAVGAGAMRSTAEMEAYLQSLTP